MGLFFKFLGQQKPTQDTGQATQEDRKPLSTLPWIVDRTELVEEEPSPLPVESAPRLKTPRYGVGVERLMMDRLGDIGLDRISLKKNLVRAADGLALGMDQMDKIVIFEDAFRRANPTFAYSGFDVAAQMAQDMGLNEPENTALETPAPEGPKGAAGDVAAQMAQEKGPNEPESTALETPAPEGPKEAAQEAAQKVPVPPLEVPGPTEAEKRLSMNIRSRRERMRKLYSQLAAHPAMNNWVGVLLFFLTAIATRSPSFAATLFLRNPNRQAILDELAALRDEIRLDLQEAEIQNRMEEARRNEARQARQMAISLAGKKELEEQRHQHLVERMHLGFNLKAERAESAAPTSKVKETIRALRDEFTRLASLASKVRIQMNQYRSIFGAPQKGDPDYDEYKKARDQYYSIIDNMYKLDEEIKKLTPPYTP